MKENYKAKEKDIGKKNYRKNQGLQIKRPLGKKKDIGQNKKIIE
jgi:hypothetical protein